MRPNMEFFWNMQVASRGQSPRMLSIYSRAQAAGRDATAWRGRRWRGMVGHCNDEERMP